jgi:hypothetical protein
MPNVRVAVLAATLGGSLSSACALDPGPEGLEGEPEVDEIEAPAGPVSAGYPWYECLDGWPAQAHKPEGSAYVDLAIGTSAYKEPDTGGHTTQSQGQARSEVQDECRRIYGDDCACIVWKENVPWFGYRVRWFAMGLKVNGPEVVNPTIWRDGIAGNPDTRPGSILSIYGVDFGASGNIVHFLQSSGEHVVSAGSPAWYESPGQINVQMPPAVHEGWVDIYVETPAGDSNLELIEVDD